VLRVHIGLPVPFKAYERVYLFAGGMAMCPVALLAKCLLGPVRLSRSRSSPTSLRAFAFAVPDGGASSEFIFRSALT
jgi:hypothetical protein